MKNKKSKKIEKFDDMYAVDWCIWLVKIGMFLIILLILIKWLGRLL